jgi:hypothetical protein
MSPHSLKYPRAVAADALCRAALKQGYLIKSGRHWSFGRRLPFHHRECADRHRRVETYGLERLQCLGANLPVWYPLPLSRPSGPQARAVSTSPARGARGGRNRHSDPLRRSRASAAEHDPCRPVPGQAGQINIVVHSKFLHHDRTWSTRKGGASGRSLRAPTARVESLESWG